ncbi:hypothetical protein PIB30_027091 [Stylosanthes scabra]|uniref:Uncharacterized protein n=1 Tax=Stylosanthes scabra TaxID=79078 RepID=A0ABU6VCT8_9FABA|nr:hypothetical protein [Stylosanthes scabra]
MKKKSCLNIRVPRVLSDAEKDLYGWVDEEVFSQPSVGEADMLPELCHEMRLTADRAAEGNFVLEVAGPSNQLPFGALEDRTRLLWVYAELFTRLGVQLPFTDFQREIMTRYRVVVSQLHAACILVSCHHGYALPLGVLEFRGGGLPLQVASPSFGFILQGVVAEVGGNLGESCSFGELAVAMAGTP